MCEYQHTIRVYKMNKIVLLVDDDQRVLDGMCRILRKEPYQILTANSGETALELIRAMKVHVIVSDENMPGMNGTKLLSLARKQSPDTVRMMITGEGNFELAIKAINEGEIYRFFTKPYNEIELGIAIRQAIQQSELVREARGFLAAVRDKIVSKESLERRWPGISDVKRDRRGAILLEDSDLGELIDEMRGERTNLERMQSSERRKVS